MCLNNWYITDNNSVRVKRYAKTYVTRRNRWIIKDYAKARFTLHNTFYKVADKFTHARSIPLNRPIWKWIESFGRLECHLFRSFDHSRDSKLANEHPIFPRFSFFHESLRRKIILALVVILSYFFPFPPPLHLPPLINDKREHFWITEVAGEDPSRRLKFPEIHLPGQR